MPRARSRKNCLIRRPGNSRREAGGSASRLLRRDALQGEAALGTGPKHTFAKVAVRLSKMPASNAAARSIRAGGAKDSRTNVSVYPNTCTVDGESCRVSAFCVEARMAMAQRHGEEFWGKHVKAWAGSAVAPSAYCAGQGLNVKSFRRWARRLKGQDSPGGLTLAPVSVQAPPGASAVRLRSPAGWQSMCLTPGQRTDRRRVPFHPISRLQRFELKGVLPQTVQLVRGELLFRRRSGFGTGRCNEAAKRSDRAQTGQGRVLRRIVRVGRRRASDELG
jgi:hypothetical protein